MLKINNIPIIMKFMIFLLFANLANGQIYYDMSTGNFTETFTSWVAPNNGSWSTVAINNSGSIPNALKTTGPTDPTTFKTSTTGGIQSNTTSIQFLATGATDNTSSVALDLNLNFTNRTAGSLLFDVATVFNSTGNRSGSLRVYYTIDGGLSWNELLGNLPFLSNNNVAGSASILINTLPSEISNKAQVKFRFYYHNGGTTLASPAGSRPKISIDNVKVTSTAIETVLTPTISIDDISIVEGNTGTTNAIFTVTLINPTIGMGDITFDYATNDGSTNTATAGTDYSATNGTGTISYSLQQPQPQ